MLINCRAGSLKNVLDFQRRFYLFSKTFQRRSAAKMHELGFYQVFLRIMHTVFFLHSKPFKDFTKEPASHARTGHERSHPTELDECCSEEYPISDL